MNQKKTNLKNFPNVYNLRNLIKEKTCFKNAESPSCTDLVLNLFSGEVFVTQRFFETGLSDIRKMIVSVLKTHFLKQHCSKVVYPI